MSWDVTRYEAKQRAATSSLRRNVAMQRAAVARPERSAEYYKGLENKRRERRRTDGSTVSREGGCTQMLGDSLTAKRSRSKEKKIIRSMNSL